MSAREWMLRAACRDHDPELFFPLPKDLPTRREAKKICHRCPVIAECVLYAKELRVTDGVWGGSYHNLPSRGTNRGYTDECGTEAGAKRHWTKGEKPCEACGAAVREARKRRIEAR